MNPAVRCDARIDGPPMRKGSRVVLWRHYCRNLTRHPSGRCYLHRRPEEADHR